MENNNLKYIKRTNIIANPLNSFEVKELDDLKNSIKVHGLLDPLAVIGPLDNEIYMIIAGERRYRSICELAKETPGYMDVVPCHIVGSKDMSELQQKLLIEVSNLETRSFNVNEHRAKVMGILKAMVDSGELKDHNIAAAASEYFKTSKRYGRYWRRVFCSDNEDIKKMVANDQMTIVNANKFINLDKEKQEEAMDQIQKGENPNKVVEAFKNGTKRQELTMEELCSVDIDDFVVDEADIDMANRDKKLMKDNKPSSKEYKQKLDAVRAWCEKILEVENPTDDEWVAIEACMDVADKFR